MTSRDPVDAKQREIEDEVIVTIARLDADTGQMKRYWGAYGNKPDDTNLGPYNPSAPPSQQFRNPVHCIERSVDNLVYAATHGNRLEATRGGIPHC
jgi:hypothetical protein